MSTKAKEAVKEAPGGSSSAEIDAYVRSLKHVEQSPEAEFTLQSAETRPEVGGYVCKTETFKGSPAFNTFMVSPSNVDVMYPGSLLKGQSVIDKTYTPSSIVPGPLTLTVNLRSIDGVISRTIEEPSFSAVQSAIHEILSQNITGDAGAQMSWSFDSIYSKAHLKMKMGMEFDVADIAGGSGSLGIDFTADTKKAIVQYRQKYYDVIIDVPRSPADYIHPDVNLDAVMGIFRDVSPMYVSSVSYGRYVLFSFETSDLSLDLEHELKASIKVPVEGVPVKIGGSRKLEAGFKSGSLRSKAYILGGSGKLASRAINSMDALLEFIATGGTYSKDSPGRPISYNLRYLSDNYPVQVVDDIVYTKKQYSKICSTYRVSAVSFDLKRLKGQWAALPQIDLYGWLTARSSASSGEKLVLWHKNFVDSYPVRVGDTKNINQSVDVTFGALKPEARKQAYIDIGMDINARWALFFEEFNPRGKRIYLHGLAEGEHTESIKTQWHELTITFQVTAIK